MQRLLAFVRLTRPEFLVGGFLFFWLGTRAAGAELTLAHYVAGQGMVTSIQLFAQYVNEHFDQATDAISTNRTWFSGGSGVLPLGRLPSRTALWAASVSATSAIVFGAWASTHDSRLGIIGIVALVGSWLYSAPPVRLIATGSGEVIAALIVSGLVPLTGALSRGQVDWALLLAFTTPLVLANLAMLLAVDAPDEDADAATGKLTLWVRLGRRRAARWHGVVLLLASGTLLLLAPWRPAWSTARALLVLPLFAAQQYLIQEDRPTENGSALTLLAVLSVGGLALTMGSGTLL